MYDPPAETRAPSAGMYDPPLAAVPAPATPPPPPPTFAAGSNVPPAAMRQTYSSSSIDPLALAVEASPNAMIVIDGRQQITHASRSAEVMFGRSLVGLEISELLPEPARPEHRRQVASYIADPVERSMGMTRVISVPGPMGTPIKLNIDLGPHPAGRGAGAIASIRDITALHVEKAAVQEAQELAAKATDELALLTAQAEAERQHTATRSQFAVIRYVVVAILLTIVGAGLLAAISALRGQGELGTDLFREIAVLGISNLVALVAGQSIGPRHQLPPPPR